MPPEYRARIEASRPMLLKRAREQYGLELQIGPTNIDSLTALIADKYAEQQGKGAQFHRAVMKAYWQEARSIDDLAVLQEIAQTVDLDTTHFAESLQNARYAQEVKDDIQQALQYGLDAVPALVFEDKYVVMGAQPYDVLKRVVERVQSEMGA